MDKNSGSLENKILKICIIILLLIGIAGYLAIKDRQKNELRRIEHSYNALLQDTLEQVQSKTDTFWIQSVSSLTPDEVYNSHIYQELDSVTQVLIEELKDVKGLLASMNVHVIATREENIRLRDELSQWRVQDTIFMTPDGTVLTFKDTTGALQYEETIILSDTIDKSARYTLSFTPDLRITKINKYSVQGEWRLLGLNDFDNVTLTNGFTYYGTLSEQERRRKKMLSYLKYAGIGSGFLLSYYAGIRTGAIITK